MGMLILYVGPANPVNLVVGLPLSVGPLIESVEFRDAFKLTINRVSGGKYFQHVEQKNIRADNVINIQGDQASVSIGKKADYSPNELVEHVYTPLRKEATSWLDPLQPMYTVSVWQNLDHEKPYLLQFVPKDIADIFAQAKTLYIRVSSLALTLTGTWDEAILTAREKLDLTKTKPGSGQQLFRVMSGNQYLVGVWLAKLWASGKTLKQWATDFVETNYPGTAWELDLQIEGFTVGETEVTLRFAEVAEGVLRQNPRAVEYRQKYRELTELGVKARRRINEEMKRLVRLKA